ncbi:MAG: response regulator [Deltaproteobacteria bacterium]|nr:MAG: response regulator [Deltaproteobacteria bacterium]
MSIEKATVLIADDDPDIRRILRTHLEEHCGSVLVAANGDEALETILVEQPDLVILDVMMPGLNGWEICRYVREKEGLGHVGILMLTAIGQEVNAMTAPLYGADEYLDKPFLLDAVDEALERVLSIRDERVAASD